jgi:hypothetical protein
MEWIRCEDKLPDEGVYVLTYWKNHDEYRLDYIIHDEKDKFWACVLDDDGNIVTHWMELPKPPED